MKNSWILSQPLDNRYNHTYFCTCTHKFSVNTMIDKPEAPDILCPACDNDYFKDVNIFEDMQSTKIWMYFGWKTVTSEDDKNWKITLSYEVPSYDEKEEEIIFKNKSLLDILFRKDGYGTPEVTLNAKIVNKYSLFLDDRVQSFRKLLIEDAKLSLYKLVLSKKNIYKEFLNNRNISEASMDDKLVYVRETQLLHFILDKHKQKSIRKSLYRGYESSIEKIKHYPYSDYVFTNSIDNIDLLMKLYKIDPEIKQGLFRDKMFLVAIEFIQFLKNYYTQKQIVRLFIEDIQASSDYEDKLLNWRDTLRMVETQNDFNSLENHFIKVKLTTKNLHDEIIRVSQIVSYELNAKEDFEYAEKYLSACTVYKELEFRLPLTVKELSIWAKTLHNCMFGYTKAIHQGKSTIYGVFKANELLYAIELKNSRIIQAKAVSNAKVPAYDMIVIEDWCNKTIV